MAFCVAAGINWQGRRTRGGPVLYLATEGGRSLEARIIPLREKHGRTGIPMAVKTSPVNLLDPKVDIANLRDLLNEIEQEHGKLALIVIDTLSRAMAGGNENGAEDMTVFISNIDALRDHTGAHMLIVHHTGKDKSKGARGHSSLKAATDTEIELENKGGVIFATATKQRDMAAGEPVSFTLRVHELGVDSDGDPITTCTIDAPSDEKVRDAKQKRPTGANQKALLNAFKQMRQDKSGKPNPGGTGYPEPGKYWCIPEVNFRKFATGKLSGDNTSSAFSGAYKSMILSGYMVQNEGHVWIAAKEGKC
jgi:hypothetical protein